VKRIGVVAATGLVAAVVVLGCWILTNASPESEPALAASGPSEVSETDPAEPIGPPRFGPSTEETALVARAFSTAEELRTARAVRRAEEVPPGTGTVILVVDSRDETPIERFALRIWSGTRGRDADATEVGRSPVKAFPEGAVLVEAPLEGFRFSIHAPGYVPLSGEVVPVSSTDRRAILSLERTAVVRGRLMHEGRPVAEAFVMVRGGCPDRSARSSLQEIHAESWYEDLDSEARRRADPKTEWDTTDEEGRFEVPGLLPGLAELSARAAELELDRELGELEVGAELDLGEREMTKRSQPPVEWDSVGLGFGESGEGVTTYYADGEAVHVEPWGPDVSGDYRSRSSAVRSRQADGTVRVQAFDGAEPLVGATVLAQRVGNAVVEEVGRTDELGEAVVSLEPGEPTSFHRRIGSQLPVGSTDTPVTVASGSETLVPIIVRSGSLVLELPEDLTPAKGTALVLQLTSDVLPEPGFVVVTLRGEDGELEREGLCWKGHRCELPSIAAGSYRVELDVMKGQGSGTLHPTERRFAGEVRVVAGEERVCSLAAR